MLTGLALPDLSKAHVEFEHGDLGKALATLGKANDINSRILRGQIEEILAPGEGQEYLKAFAENPKNAIAAAWAGHAYSLWGGGSKQKAIELLRLALTLDSKNGEIHSLLGRALFKNGKRDEGLKEMQLAENMQANSFYIIANLADSYLDQFDSEKALAEYNKLISSHPLMPLAYVKRANYFSSKGQTQSALQDYDKAIKINPHCRLALSSKAELLCSLNRWEETAAISKRCLEQEPGENDNLAQIARRVRVRAELAMHQDKNAIEDLNILIGANPKKDSMALSSSFRELILLRAECWERAGKLNLAGADLDRLESSGKSSAEVLCLKAKILEDKGDNAAALKLYDTLIDRGMPTPDFFRARSRVYKNLGKMDLSKNDLQKAQKMENPQF